MVWNFLFKNNTSTKEFIEGLCRLNRRSMVDCFKYCKDLEKNVYDFKTNSCTDFRETSADDDLCSICLNKLVGHCCKFACDCGLSIHESCMFKYMLGGYTKCPVCELGVSLHKYRTTIKYPMTMDTRSVLEQYKRVADHNVQPKEALQFIERSTIKDGKILRSIYRLSEGSTVA